MNLSDEVILDTVQGVIDDILKPKFISLGMNASGQWLASLEARVSNGVGEIWGLDYTYYLANGRAPGNMPPITPLISWVGHKFGYSGRQAVSTAFAVANKIAKEGTSYYPEGTDLLEVLNSNEVNEYIKDRIGRFLIRSIQVDILKRTKETLITA